jgi:hypothetical protein
MTSITSDILNGRFCNQLIRSIASSLLAEKHNLKVSYAIYDKLKLLGLDLFNGQNTWETTIQLTDSNYFDILNLEKLESNLDPNLSYFQTKEIIQKVYDCIQSNKDSIILANTFKERYNNNNDCFVHIRLDDASQWNPGFIYYNNVISNLKYDTLYISTDQLNHPLISQITSKYPAILIQYSEVNTIKFASTCKYIILSHGTFSSCIGYFSFFSDIFYPDFRNLKKWHGDIFSISGWNRVYYTTLTKDDIITTDKYLQAFPKNYFKTDTIVNKSPCVWRNTLVSPPSKDLTLIISGHSDYGITDDLVEYYTPTKWWTVNKQSHKVFALPLGITNNTNESHIHPIYGNLDVMIEAMNMTKKNANLVYMNFNISTYPKERQSVFNLFQDKEWVTKGSIENTLEGRGKFLQDIRNHTFVLCPRGNGIDTHRLWETLYMESIPIVKKDIALTDFEDLPICFIDSWEEITKEFLENEKDRILSKVWNTDKLKISYWREQIVNSVSILT